jgi:hypothetical protein
MAFRLTIVSLYSLDHIDDPKCLSNHPEISSPKDFAQLKKLQTTLRTYN